MIGTGHSLSYPGLPSGTLTVTVVVTDGSSTTSQDIRMLVEVTDRPTGGDGDGGPSGAIYAVVVLLVVVMASIVAFYLLRMRQQPQE